MFAMFCAETSSPEPYFSGTKFPTTNSAVEKSTGSGGSLECFRGGSFVRCNHVSLLRAEAVAATRRFLGGFSVFTRQVQLRSGSLLFALHLYYHLLVRWTLRIDLRVAATGRSGDNNPESRSGGRRCKRMFHLHRMHRSSGRSKMTPEWRDWLRSRAGVKFRMGLRHSV